MKISQKHTKCGRERKNRNFSLSSTLPLRIYKKTTICLFWTLLMIGCESKQTEPLPIAKDELIRLMFDVHVAEGALSHTPAGHQRHQQEVYYDQVTKIHEISRADLDTCLVILQRNPELAKDIYEKVLEMMEKKRVEH
ncbi:MAG: DUF4296 domain-containing protein [Saprospiraceae bacterium]|nr:DUF4296 domain-containing protein [Saprospiraceae bacterium]